MSFLLAPIDTHRQFKRARRLIVRIRAAQSGIGLVGSATPRIVRAKPVSMFVAVTRALAAGPASRVTCPLEVALDVCAETCGTQANRQATIAPESH